MPKIFSTIWKKIYSYNALLTGLIVLALFLFSGICSNLVQQRKDRLRSILLLSRAAEMATMQGYIPNKTYLRSLEQAYYLGGASTKPYAGFLSSCFYLHNDPLRGAHYAGLAYLQGAHIQSPMQKLQKEITEAQAIQNYPVVLKKAQQLLSLIDDSSTHPTLKFLTLLRIISVKELLQEDIQDDLRALQALPLFKEFEEFYKDGNWTLSRRFEAAALLPVV